MACIRKFEGARSLAGIFCGLLIAATVTPATTSAQSPVQPVKSISDDPFYPIGSFDWPSVGIYRTATGRPGHAYWQQRADYSINVSLDTINKVLSGSVSIRYTNNSPDNLPFLWISLEQNLYRPNSMGSAMFSANSRWGVRGFAGGISVTDLKVDGKTAEHSINDTRMRVMLGKPLAGGGKAVVITMNYTFPIPEHGSDRMGRDGRLYEMAQWYPRMAVYDDVRGWNAEPYFGQGEFYLGYGNYDFSVTLPAGYTVAATGTLQNASQVLTRAQQKRLSVALKSDTVVPVITREEAQLSNSAAVVGTKTWRFKAENVRDVAWSAAPDYRWDAVGWNGVLCQAYYSVTQSGKAWESAAEQTRFSIKTYSELFYPYPYPQATSVAGPVGGMEYPMFMMIHTGRGEPDNPEAIFRTLDHEHGHSWFPMLVGTNERRFAWFDEGINMYMNTFSNERRYKGAVGESFYPALVKNWRDIRDKGLDKPIMTPPDQIHFAGLGALAYRKPAVLLFSLRNHIVGKETFDRAFRDFIATWAFKHPTPGDFFRFVESYHGSDLSWYWRNFWYSTSILDIGVTGVTNTPSKDGTTQSVIKLENFTGVPFPVTVRIKLVSGTIHQFKLPVEVWTQGGGESFDGKSPVKRTIEHLMVGTETVVGVRIFPDPSVPDWNRENDTWGDAPPPDLGGPVSM